MTVTGVFNFENDTPVENWLLNSVDGLTGCTITLPTDWVQVMQLTNTEAWPLLFSLSTERIEKERLNIPVAAFRFWEQKEFKELLHETTDKSALYKFKPEEEKMQSLSPDTESSKAYVKSKVLVSRKCSRNSQFKIPGKDDFVLKNHELSYSGAYSLQSSSRSHF